MLKFLKSIVYKRDELLWMKFLSILIQQNKQQSNEKKLLECAKST